MTAPQRGPEGLLGIHYAQAKSVAPFEFCTRPSSTNTHYKVITIVMVDNAILFEMVHIWLPAIHELLLQALGK